MSGIEKAIAMKAAKQAIEQVAVSLKGYRISKKEYEVLKMFFWNAVAPQIDDEERRDEG